MTREQLLNGDWDVIMQGGLFKRHWWFMWDDPIPANTRWVRYWDFAATEKRENNDPDWTAGAKVGLTPAGEIIIADIRRIQDRSMGVEAEVKLTAELDGTGVPVYIEQEPGASGKAVIDYYRRQVLQGYTVRGHRPSGPKVERATPVSARAEAGEVYLVRGMWNVPFIDEADLFPMGAHDDQVDSVSGAYSVLVAGGTMSGRLAT